MSKIKNHWEKYFIDIIPAAISKKYEVIPVDIMKGFLFVVMSDPYGIILVSGST